MKKNTEKLYELTVTANDTLLTRHPKLPTVVGLMDKALRAKGINAEAVTVDHVTTKMRLVLIILDGNEHVVGFGVGNTTADNIDLLSEHRITELSAEKICSMLEKHLL